MAFNATKREQKDFVQKVGLFEGEVVAINPDKAGLQKLLGENADIKEEPKYVTEKEEEDENGVKSKITQLIFSVWLKDVKTGGLFPAKFFIKNKPKENKTKDKMQYINSQGSSTWADDKNNLAEWFLKAGRDGIRIAKEGEADFYEFLKSWLNQINFKEAYELSFDMKKLMSGNFKEIVDLMKADVRGTVLALATVKEAEDSQGEKKNYQQVYNRAFAPGYLIKNVRATPIDEEFIEKAEEAKRNKKLKPLQRFILTIVDSEFGVKDHYKLTELTDYVPGENLAATEKAIDSSDSEY